MITPNLSEFKKLAKKGNLIAVTEQIAADLETPVSTFLKLAGKEDHAFLLESAEQGEKIGRYSIIGLKPKQIIQSKNKTVTLQKKGRKSNLKAGVCITSILEKSISNYKLANKKALPGFSGGFVGYLAYENVERFEKIKLEKRKSIGVPDSIFFLSEELILFDHYRKTLSLAILVDAPQNKVSEKSYRSACNRIRALKTKLAQPLRISQSSKRKGKIKIKSNMTATQFKSKVNRIKQYIREGDCIQTVLSQRFKIDGIRDDFQIYRALRSINPSPYMFYFKSKSVRLIGASPEVLVKKTGSKAEVRPIAGTRPRGKTPKEDLKYAESLKRSTKEMAEHLMLVDLGRNDLGRVCQFDSIQVEDYARIENYSHVMHLVSDVVGTLKKGKNAFDLIRATFPAGTVSGAPKVRAMQIINELEPEARGPYAGALGYFSFDQDMDMCITIRTLVVKGKDVYLQAGAGIVKDSNPDREYEETYNKAKALLKAIEMQEAF